MHSSPVRLIKKGLRQERISRGSAALIMTLLPMSGEAAAGKGGVTPGEGQSYDGRRWLLFTGECL